ncbi:MAG: hypothetical protein N2C14_29510, partial [Planctomycetales bacterium]
MSSLLDHDSCEMILVSPEIISGKVVEEQDAAPAAEVALVTPEIFSSTVGGRKMWLSGGVLGTPCPTCNSPMSVRVWLMVADCWGCGCSVELSEDEEREALRLLEQQEQAAAAPVAKRAKKKQAPLPSPKPAKPTKPKQPIQVPVAAPVAENHVAPFIESVPANQPPPKKKRRKKVASTAAVMNPIGVRRRLGEIREEGETRVWMRDRFKETPAWLVSLVVHLLLMIWAATWLLDDMSKHREFTLTARISGDDPIGDFDQEQELLDETQFEAPSDFPVEVLSSEEVPSPDDTPLDDPTSTGMLQVENSPLEFVGAPEMVVGDVGMFDGRGEASRGMVV